MVKINAQPYPLAFVTCLETGNMPPAYQGQKMAFFSQGRRGTLGASWLDDKVEELLAGEVRGVCALWRLKGPKNKWARVLLEVYGPQRELILLGAGHIGREMDKLGNYLGYRVTVIDNRPDYAMAENFDPRTRVICCPYSQAHKYVDFGGHTNVLVATYGHLHDLDCLELVLKYDLPYLGVVGSRHRRELVKEHLLSEGIPTARINKIHMPVGLDIGAKTPPELALSIMAEILALENRKSGISLRDVGIPKAQRAKEGGLLSETPDINLLEQALRYGKEGKAGALATVVAAGPSTPRKSGAKMLILEDGLRAGTIGGGFVENNVIAEARKVIAQPGLILKSFSLRPGPEQDVMLCGGDMEVFIEPLGPLGALLSEEDINNAKLF